MKLFLPIIIAFVLVGSYLLINKSFLQEKTLPSETTRSSPISKELKKFDSEILKLSVNLPIDFTIVETSTYINLEKGQGKINISKNGTNEEDVNNYIEDFDSKRKGLTVENQKEIKIGDLNAIKRLEKFTAGPIAQQYIYYIYVDSKVYTLSTSSEFLYSDLDQIAKSFRYIP